MTSVWPALWPPWKRTTMSARLASQSTTLPLPSSPHWAPITATLAIALLRGDGGETAVGQHVRAGQATRLRGRVRHRIKPGDGGITLRAQRDGLRRRTPGGEIDALLRVARRCGTQHGVGVE